MNVPEPDSDRSEALDPAPFRAELQALYAALERGPRGGADLRVERTVLPVRGIRPHPVPLRGRKFAVLLADAPEPVRPVDDGASCPWQDDRGRCHARTARPLGCRVYYCEPSYQDRGQELSERYLARLRDAHQPSRASLELRPLHHHLHRAVAAGRLPRGTEPRPASDGRWRRVIPDIKTVPNG